MILNEPRRIPRTGDDRPAPGLLRYVIRMSGPHQAAICALAIGVSLLNLVPIELQRRMIDDGISAGSFETLLWLAALYAAVVVAHKAAKGGLGLYQAWLSQSAIHYTRRHLTGIYCQRAAEKDVKSGEAVSIITAEADKLGGFVGSGPSQAATNIAMLVGVLGYMLYVQPQIALLGVALLIPQVILTPLIQRRLNALTEERLVALRRFGDELAEERACNDEDTRGLIHRIYRTQILTAFWKNLMKALLNLLNQLAPLGVLLWAGWMVIQGETTVGVVVAFISGFERIANPVRELLTLYRTTQNAVVQHRMIARWM